MQLIRCARTLVLAAVLAQGCAAGRDAGTAEPGPARASPPTAAPAPQPAGPHRPDEPIDLAACAALPERHGLVPEHPLEWGNLASLGEGRPWFERLVCPGGAVPVLERQGSLGAAPPSASPACGFAEMLGADNAILDLWSVRCPGREPQQWYMSAYRCGSLCPPRGFSVVPREALLAIHEAFAAFQRKQPQDGVVPARRAQALAPEVELTNGILGSILLAAGEDVDALVFLRKASAINPAAHALKLKIAIAVQVVQGVEAYDAMIAELVETVPSEHPIHPELLCRRAHGLRRAGDEAQAVGLARQACEKGIQLCCGFVPEGQPDAPEAPEAPSSI